MKEFSNTSLRHLEWSEMEAIQKACELIEKVFKKKIYKVQVTGDTTNPTDVHGVMIAFDKWEQGVKR